MEVLLDDRRDELPVIAYYIPQEKWLQGDRWIMFGHTEASEDDGVMVDSY